MNKMKPLYRWAGGKTKMIKHYQKELSNLGNVKTLVEPFFGAGAFTIYASNNFNSIDHFVINDIKGELIDIYRCLKTDYQDFKEVLDSLDREYITLDKAARKMYYYEIREHYYDGMDSFVEETSTLYFLLKTCFNGIWQGKTGSPRFYTPCGLLKEKDSVYDQDNLKAWADFLQNASLHSEDWESVSRKYSNQETLHFFDPPYRDSFTSYSDTFGDDEQLRLVNFCNTTEDTVMLTNRDAGDGFFDNSVDSKRLSIKQVPVTYTAGRRKKTEEGFEAKKAIEVLIHSNRLKDNTLTLWD